MVPLLFLFYMNTFYVFHATVFISFHSCSYSMSPCSFGGDTHCEPNGWLNDHSSGPSQSKTTSHVGRHGGGRGWRACLTCTLLCRWERQDKFQCFDVHGWHIYWWIYTWLSAWLILFEYIRCGAFITRSIFYRIIIKYARLYHSRRFLN